MIDANNTNLCREIRSACRERDARLSAHKTMVKRYAGPFFQNDADRYDPENHAYEWVNSVMAAIAFDNPRWKVTSKRGKRLQAGVLQRAMNRWTRDHDLHGTLAWGPVLDMQFSWGVLMCVCEPHVDYPQEVDGVGGPGRRGFPWSPHAYKVDVEDFVWDPTAKSREAWEWAAHKVVVDKRDLLARAKEGKDYGWNADAIEAIGENQGLSKEELDKRKDIERHEVVYWEMWVPGAKPEDLPEEAWEEWEEMDRALFNGVIYTVCETGDPQKGESESVFIRAPRPFFGPRWGPYTIFGAMSVPGQSAPLSPLLPIEGQVRDLNSEASAMNISSEAYKRLVFVDSTDKKLPGIVKNGKHDHVFTVTGMTRDSIVPAEIGGVTNQQVMSYQIKRERLDRNSGMSDAARGNVTGAATATENAIASEFTSRRIAVLKQAVVKATVMFGRTVMWYLHHDNRIAFPLGPDADAEELGGEAAHQLDEWFGGGAEEGDDFDSYEFDIEPYSMERVSDAQLQRQAQFMLTFATNIAPIMPQAPHIKWPKLIAKIGDALNLPDFDEIVDIGALAQMTQMFAMTQIASLQETQISSQAKLAPKQTGGAPQNKPPQAKQTKQPGDQKGPKLGGKAQSPVASPVKMGV